MDMLNQDVNSAGFNPAAVNPSGQEQGNNIPPDSQGVKSDEDAGILRNKVAELERKLERERHEKEYVMKISEKMLQKPAAVQTQPKTEEPPNPFESVSDAQLAELELNAQSPETIEKIKEFRQLKTKYENGLRKQTANELAALKAEIADLKVKVTAKPKPDIYSEFPALRDPLSEGYKAIEKEWQNELDKGKPNNNETILFAAYKAKANNPYLFSADSKVDNSGKLIDNHLSDKVKHGKAADAKDDEDVKLTQRQLAIAAELGVDSKSLKESFKKINKGNPQIFKM